MNNIEKLTIITHEEFGSIRVLKKDNDVFCSGSDLAKILGHKDPTHAVLCHCLNTKRHLIYTIKDCMGRNQQMKFITTNDMLMLIQKSKVKSTEYKEKIKNWLTKNDVLKDGVFIESRKEIEFLDLLENVLEPFDFKCYRQKLACDNKYKIDLYIEDLNIAIEYDENDHKNYTYEQEEGRQIEIEQELNCEFIRLKDSESNAYNVGLVLKYIFRNKTTHKTP